MIDSARFLAVIALSVSSLLVAIGNGMNIFTKDSKVRIAPFVRQLGRIWFGIGCVLFLVSLFNLIAYLSGLPIEYLVLGFIALTVTFGILAVIVQLIRLTAPAPRS